MSQPFPLGYVSNLVSPMTPESRCIAKDRDGSPGGSGAGEGSPNGRPVPLFRDEDAEKRERFLRAILAARDDRGTSGCEAPLDGGGPQEAGEQGAVPIEWEMAIREDERKRIAADLHDELCPELIGVSGVAAAVKRLLEKEGHPLAEKIGAISEAVSKAAGRAKRMVHGLDPVVEHGDGLVDALRDLAAATARAHRIRCDFACHSPLASLDTAASQQLFRIAQEAVRNAVRHSEAQWIELEVGETASEIRLVVADDGCGIPQALEAKGGYGLRGMNYRAEQIRACLSVRQREGGGTEVVCRCPKAGPNAGSRPAN